MSELTDRLAKAGEQHKGTGLGGLLQWAVLHIADQDEALAEVREDVARDSERYRHIRTHCYVDSYRATPRTDTVELGMFDDTIDAAITARSTK